MQKILLLEDDATLGNGIVLALNSESSEIILCSTLAEARKAYRHGAFQLLIIDINLPDGSGLDFLREVRRQDSVPIILLTAKSETEDKVLGLNVGADDYITKPFVPVEVLARVRSQLRRYARLGSCPETPGALEIGGICLDDSTKSVTVDGEPVSLTPTEYAILHLLMKNPGRVFSTRKLYEEVWQEAALGSEGAVAVHIRHLREKIEINPSEPRYLKVVWGQGYKMEGEK